MKLNKLTNFKVRFEQVYKDYYNLINRTNWLDVDTKDAINYRVETLKSYAETVQITWEQAIKDLVYVINTICEMTSSLKDISKRLYYV